MGLWEAKGKLCLHLIQKNHWVKRQSILLPTREGHLWEQCDKCPRKDIFCQMEELCKCMAPKALSDVFVFQMCNKSFNGSHTTPLGNRDFSAGIVAWCIRREPFFTAFCGDSALWPIEKPIVVNIRGFGLLNIYSLFPGNRISTFFWEKPLPYSQSPSRSALLPPPSCWVWVWPGLGQWVCAVSRVRDGHETQAGPMNSILGLFVATVGEEKLLVGLGHCEDAGLEWLVVTWSWWMNSWPENKASTEQNKAERGKRQISDNMLWASGYS